MNVRAFKQPSSCCVIAGAIVTMCGPFLLMPVEKDRSVLFEMHHYFGPIPLSKRTEEELRRIPKGFWPAYEKWDSGGRLVDGDLCVTVVR